MGKPGFPGDLGVEDEPMVIGQILASLQNHLLRSDGASSLSPETVKSLKDSVPV